MTRRGHILIASAAAAVLAAAGTGAGLAAGPLGSSKPKPPEQRQEQLLEDLAGRLGVSVDKLKAALAGVAAARLDQAVADGRLTQAQADALKKRLSSGRLPLGPGLGLGFGLGPHPGGGLARPAFDAAASYLGLTTAELRTQLAAGKSLADVAAAQHKSVDGLEQALLDAASTRLDAAVQSGRIAADRKAQVLDRLKSAIDRIVHATPPRGHVRFRF